MNPTAAIVLGYVLFLLGIGLCLSGGAENNILTAVVGANLLGSGVITLAIMASHERK